MTLQKQTKNTYTPTDPAFPYLLCFFTLLTSLAWSLAYGAPRAAVIARIAAVFVLGHCLGGSLLVAAGMYFCVGALLGRGGWLVKSGSGGGRGRGLFGVAAGGKGKGEELEFGFCFDVSAFPILPGGGGGWVGGCGMFGEWADWGGEGPSRWL